MSMTVTNKDLSERLFKLSGWVCNPIRRVAFDGKMREVVTYEQRYDLDFLLAKLQPLIKDRGRLCINYYINDGVAEWSIEFASYNQAEPRGRAPELRDAAALLCCTLIERGELGV
jgi:hypothetical protein